MMRCIVSKSGEYILLLAVVALIIMKFKGEATKRIGQLTGKVFDAGDSIADQILSSSD